MDQSNWTLPTEDKQPILPLNQALDKLSNHKLKCFGNILLALIDDSDIHNVLFLDQKIQINKVFEMLEIEVKNIDDNSIEKCFDPRIGGQTFEFLLPDEVVMPCNKSEIEMQKKYRSFLSSIQIDLNDSLVDHPY
jgi:hypothetical protein